MNLTSLKINLKPNEERELREMNESIMNVISSLTHLFLGGSADLSSSTKTNISSLDSKNIHYGTRENAMGAISNGLATLNLRPFASTFLTFSDYLKPSIRNTALMKLPVSYVFTHDSILIGEDGETHAPVEQLGMLRSIPNMTVFRPCDVKELIGSWDYIINMQVLLPGCNQR
jgi:transketolase